MIEVYNKIDQADNDRRTRIANLVKRTPLAVATSALNGEGAEELLALIGQQVSCNERLVHVQLPHSDGATLAWLHQVGQIVDRRDGQDCIRLEVRLDSANAGRLEKRLEPSLDFFY